MTSSKEQHPEKESHPDPLIEFSRIERIERGTPALMKLVFPEQTRESARDVFRRPEVKTAVIRLLGYWDSIGGALPSHNFAHAMDVSFYAVCRAVDCKTEPEHLSIIAIAGLFHDAGRIYRKNDSMVRHIVGKDDYHIAESTNRSIKVLHDRMSDQMSHAGIRLTTNAIEDPLSQLGRFVHGADAFELCNPIRNSAIAYESRVSRRQGSRWAISKFYGAMAKKLEGLNEIERMKAMQACWVLADWAYGGLHRAPVSRSVQEDLGFCAHRGIQTLLLESNGDIQSRLASMSPMFKLHSNSIRRRCMESMVKKSSRELRRLRWLMRDDKAYCDSLKALEKRGKLNKKIS
ncbi:Uncharacterised protein [uncultured archaeon]|nr:Uncharacterised protein [uncultured archaeon]